MLLLDMELPLVQLSAENSRGETFEQDGRGGWQACDYDWMLAGEGVQKLSAVVAGIGPAADW